MTRLWIMSDLHLENRAEPRRPEFTAPVCDVIVMAGDVWQPPSRAVAWASSFGRPVILVAGNHEFYGGEIDPALQAARDTMRMTPSVHFLENAVAVVAGTRFIGATLWTDFALYGTPVESAKRARRGLMDFQTICGPDGNALQAAEMVRRFNESIAFIDGVLAEPFDGPTVVVTHHAPSHRSVHDRFRGDPVTPAFASDLEWLIESRQPGLWVHGHVHDNADYRIGRTRVICNPRGYWTRQGIENTAFRPDLVVEVGA